MEDKSSEQAETQRPSAEEIHARYAAAKRKRTRVNSFALGTEAGDHLIVEIHGRPDERDDWLEARVSIRAGAFGGSFGATLMTCDFPPFRGQLERLYETLDGAATFDTIERQLRIECAGNGRGQIGIQGVAEDQVTDGNVLRFGLSIDQTFLPAIISDLQDIEAEFPNRVHPGFPQ